MNNKLIAMSLTAFALLTIPAYAEEAKCDKTERVFHKLNDLPARTTEQRIEISLGEARGRTALRAVPTVVDNTATPSLLMIPGCFRNGTISVDILARQDGTSTESRAFAGIAYRIRPDGQLESVYLRALNGKKANPPSPRDRRAIQYYAYPAWTFDKLRQAYPDGRHESGANIGPDEWVNLRVKVEETKVTVLVDNEHVLTVDKTVVDPAAGRIGLYVGFGTEAYFSNLHVESNIDVP